MRKLINETNMIVNNTSKPNTQKENAIFYGKCPQIGGKNHGTKFDQQSTMQNISYNLQSQSN